MRVVYKMPGEKPEVRDIGNELEDLQELVQGWIEHVTLKEGLGLIINEEGKLHGMMPNFFLPRIEDMIVGPAVFVGEAGGDFTDIAEEDADLILLFFGAGLDELTSTYFVED